MILNQSYEISFVDYSEDKMIYPYWIIMVIDRQNRGLSRGNNWLDYDVRTIIERLQGIAFVSRESFDYSHVFCFDQKRDAMFLKLMLEHG